MFEIVRHLVFLVNIYTFPDGDKTLCTDNHAQLYFLVPNVLECDLVYVHTCSRSCSNCVQATG